MVNDPIGDTLIQIKNGYLAKKSTVIIPYSKFKHELLKLLVREGFISEVEVKKETNKKTLTVDLKYKDTESASGNRGEPVLTDIVRVSKPGLRVYVKSNNIPRVLGGLRIAIISTPKGLMTDKQARKKKLGGELICKIW